MAPDQNTATPGPSESLAALAAYLSFSRTLDDDELIRLIMEIGVSMMKADEGSLLLLDREKEELEFMITVGESDSEKALKGQRFSMHRGITGLAASTGEPQTGEPTYHGVSQPRFQKGEQQEPTAIMAVPMLVADEVVGVITAVLFREGRTFAAEEVQLYSKFANLCGTVIRQRRREVAVREVLLGKESAAVIAPQTPPILMDRELQQSHRAIADIAGDLGQLSRGREDILPRLRDLVRLLVQITADLGWKRR
jgi:GAF domain-containing protein